MGDGRVTHTSGALAPGPRAYSSRRTRRERRSPQIGGSLASRLARGGYLRAQTRQHNAAQASIVYDKKRRRIVVPEPRATIVNGRSRAARRMKRGHPRLHLARAEARARMCMRHRRAAGRLRGQRAEGTRRPPFSMPRAQAAPSRGPSKPAAVRYHPPYDHPRSAPDVVPVVDNGALPTGVIWGGYLLVGGCTFPAALAGQASGFAEVRGSKAALTLRLHGRLGALGGSPVGILVVGHGRVGSE